MIVVTPEFADELAILAAVVIPGCDITDGLAIPRFVCDAADALLAALRNADMLNPVVYPRFVSDDE